MEQVRFYVRIITRDSVLIKCVLILAISSFIAKITAHDY